MAVHGPNKRYEGDWTKALHSTVLVPTFRPAFVAGPFASPYGGFILLISVQTPPFLLDKVLKHPFVDTPLLSTSTILFLWPRALE